MSLSLLFVLLFGIILYWAITQVLPERRKASLLRPALADGVLSALNDARAKAELPLLEWDDGLAAVAENKATHQLLTGRDEEGWDYPPSYADLLGQSLIMEALFCGPLQGVIDRMLRQRDIQGPDWIACGIGVASVESSEQVVVALIFCREAWEAAAETAHRGLGERVKAY
jgi:hypothetical protein